MDFPPVAVECANHRDAGQCSCHWIPVSFSPSLRIVFKHFLPMRKIHSPLPPPPVFSLLLTAHSSFTRPPLSPYHHRLGTDEAMSIVPTKPCQSSRAPLSQQDSSRQARSAARLARVLLGHGDSDGGEDDNSRTLLPCVVVELGRLPARAGRR